MTDPEDLATLTESLARMMLAHVASDEPLDPSGCFVVQRFAQEIGARMAAARGVNPAHYAIIVRQPARATS